MEKAESTCLNSWFRVVVGSVQTLQRSARLERFPRDYFGTIIIDEAHHAITDGYRRILDYFENAKVLGVTATPDRGDMRNLGEMFDSLAYEYKLTDAIKEGYLCKIMAQTIPLKLDISGVPLSGGDYAWGNLARRWTRIWSRSPLRWHSDAKAARQWCSFPSSKPARSSGIC